MAQWANELTFFFVFPTNKKRASQIQKRRIPQIAARDLLGNFEYLLITTVGGLSSANSRS